jgi:hypothetical protein
MTDETPPAGESRALARTITRADLTRLRAGKLEPELVSQWLRRTEGLAAPEAALTGPLPANGTGWLVAARSPGYRLFPWLSHTADRAGILAAVGPCWATMMGVDSLAVVIATGLAPMLILKGIARLLMGRQLARQQKVATFLAPAVTLPHGGHVTLTGVIPPQATVPSLFRGVPAVLFRSARSDADETRGIDFQLRLDTHHEITVAVRGAMLLDRPTRVRGPLACGPVSVNWNRTWREDARLQSDLFAVPALLARAFMGFARESAIGPGDRIQVTGLLEHQVSPEGMAGPGRHVPMRYSIRGDRDRPLLVRKLAGPPDGERDQAVRPGSGPVPP